MMKTILSLTAVSALALASGLSSPARACDDDKPAAAKADSAPQKVALTGTVVSYGCPMEAAKQQCTGAALVVGEKKHMIKKSAKGGELVGKAKDSNKTVTVTGTTAGDYLTVTTYAIKG